MSEKVQDNVVDQSTHIHTESGLQRTISWKEGLFIATGVPVLVLPSLGYFGTTLWSFSIVVWILSVAQGFFQCTAYGELATRYVNQSGLAGFVYESFKKRTKFIPALGSWGYWFAWSPVLAINTLLLGDYLKGFLFQEAAITNFQLSLIAGVVMFATLLIINWRGLMAGAYSQFVLAIVSLLPLFVLSIAPFLLGYVDYSNFTNSWLPPGWDWFSWQSIFALIGILCLAQWSACAWETAAVYAPEYKDPRKDTPKALFAAGGLCLISYPLAQAAVIGTLGIEGLKANQIAPFVPIANMILGPVGAIIVLVMLVTSMFLVANTALLGSSRAMYTMAKDGQIPAFFGKLNKNGIPFRAAIIGVIFNACLVFLKNPVTVLAASAIGYVIINGLTLFGYILTRKDHKDEKAPFQAPKWWVWVALFFGLLNIPIYFIGNAYTNGTVPTIVGFFILLTIVPLYAYARREKRTPSGKKSISM